MANKDYLSGLAPIKHKTGGEVRCVPMKLVTSNQAIGIGDPLVMETSGLVDLADAAGDEICGVSAEEKAASSTDADILVYRDPDIIFLIQCASGVNFAQTHVGNLVDLNATTYNTTTGRSRREADLTSVGTSTGQLRILKLHARDDNALGEHADIEVEIFEHQFGDKSALAGT